MAIKPAEPYGAMVRHVRKIAFHDRGIPDGDLSTFSLFLLLDDLPF